MNKRAGGVRGLGLRGSGACAFGEQSEPKDTRNANTLRWRNDWLRCAAFARSARERSERGG